MSVKIYEFSDEPMTKTIKGRPDMIANEEELTWQYIASSYGTEKKEADDCVLYARLRNVKTIGDFEACGMFSEWEQSLISDPVNHPSHYKSGGIETIDYMDAKLSPEEFRGYLKGNVLKYVSRAGKKGEEMEDLKKAQWYLNRLIETK